MEDAYFNYYWTGELPQDFDAMEQALFDSYPPLIEAHLSRYAKHGGRIGAPMGNQNAKKTIQNNSKTIKTIKTIQNNSPIEIEIETETDFKREAEADAEKESAQSTSATAAAASSKRFNVLSEEFDASSFLMKFWNLVAENHDHLKKINLASTNLQELVKSRYEELLSECNGDVATAKNQLAQVVINVSKSSWFKGNKGKATVNWIFKNWENFEKTLNGNFNDE